MARGTNLGAAIMGLAAVLCAAPAAAVDDPATLVLGIGEFDFISPVKSAALGQAEYRFGVTFAGIRPFGGIEATSDGSVYGYGGLNFDLALTGNLILTPNAAVGGWSRGDGKNLGSGIEFRTGADLAWRFADASRLGIEFHHISNAGIGNHNPGEEEILAIWAIPLHGLP